MKNKRALGNIGSKYNRYLNKFAINAAPLSAGVVFHLGLSIRMKREKDLNGVSKFELLAVVDKKEVMRAGSNPVDIVDTQNLTT